jgi:transposase
MRGMVYENAPLPRRRHRREVGPDRAAHPHLPRRAAPHDVVFYILRTGCQWHYLPKDFPPKSTVWRYFDEWRHDGTLDMIHDLLGRKARTAGLVFGILHPVGVTPQVTEQLGDRFAQDGSPWPVHSRRTASRTAPPPSSPCN